MTITRRLGEAKARVTRIEGDDMESDEIQQAIVAAKRELGLPRSRKGEDADRLSRLAEHAEEYGAGEEGRRRWNQRFADEAYSDRRTYWRAVQRALDSPKRRISKLIRVRVAESRAAGEKEATIAMSDLLAASEGDRAPTEPRLAFRELKLGPLR